MEVINYFLISLVTYIGLLIGIIISTMAKEELKPGKKYFILLHNIVLAFILFFVLEFFDVNIYLTIYLPLILIIGLFYFNDLYKKSNIFYIGLGIIFYLSSKNINNLLIISTLIFFYGFLISSLQMDFKKKNYLRILYRNLLFFICLIGLFFI